LKNKKNFLSLHSEKKKKTFFESLLKKIINLFWKLQKNFLSLQSEKKENVLFKLRKNKNYFVN
jgi:hypothetical protein